MRTMLFLIAATTLGGCNNPVYLTERRPLETQADQMGGGFAADTDLYVLPVRQPTQKEQAILRNQQEALMLPMDVPWAAARDFDIQIEYSIKNLESHPVTAFLIANGGNEFGDYDPTQYIDPTENPEDQQPPPPLLGGSPIELGANESRTGFFREDQIAEAALDLEAITRYPDLTNVIATPFQVIVHDSSASRIGLENLPPDDVVPMMVRFQLSLSADGHVVVDYNVRVRDHSEKIASPTEENLYVSTDPALPPPVAPPAAMTPAAP